MSSPSRGKGIGFKSVFTVSDRAHVLSKVGSQRVGAGQVQDVSSNKNQVFEVCIILTQNPYV